MRKNVRYLSASRFSQTASRSIFVITALQLSCSCLIRAQVTVAPVTWSVAASTGLQHASFMDTQAGKLVFSGSSFFPALNVNRYANCSETEVELGGTTVATQTNGKNKHDAKERLLSLDISQLFFLGNPQQKFRPGAGLSLGGMYISRRIPDLINAGWFTDVAASIQGVLAVRFASNPGGVGWILSEKLKASLFGVYSYAQYAAQYQTGNAASTVVISPVRWGGPGQWLRLVNTMKAGKQITGRSELGLNYEWDFYRMKAEETSRQAFHRILFYYELSL